MGEEVATATAHARKDVVAEYEKKEQARCQDVILQKLSLVAHLLKAELSFEGGETAHHQL